jgi:hypothetical protein
LARGRTPQNASIVPDLVAGEIHPSSQGKAPNSDQIGQRYASERKITFGAETDFNSRYIWRGMTLSDKPVLQPSVWISGFGFVFTAWRNFNLTQSSENIHLQATNLNLIYSRDWKKLRVEPALDVYLNRPLEDSYNPGTMEASVKLSYAVGPLRAFNIQAFDVRAYPGAYFGEAGLSYERDLTEGIVPAFSLQAGWASSKFNDAYIGFDKRAFNFVGAGCSLTYYLKHGLYFRPHLEFSNIVHRELREYVDSPTSVNFGLAAGFDF